MVYRLRRRFREIFSEEVAHTLADARDLPEEMRHLMGVLTGWILCNTPAELLKQSTMNANASPFERRCLRCGTPRDPASAEGLCPGCLMAMNLAAPTAPIGQYSHDQYGLVLTRDDVEQRLETPFARVENFNPGWMPDLTTSPNPASQSLKEN
jgi:hypothetical protein